MLDVLWKTTLLQYMSTSYKPLLDSILIQYFFVIFLIVSIRDGLTLTQVNPHACHKLEYSLL